MGHPTRQIEIGSQGNYLDYRYHIQSIAASIERGNENQKLCQLWKLLHGQKDLLPYFENERVKWKSQGQDTDHGGLQPPHLLL